MATLRLLHLAFALSPCAIGQVLSFDPPSTAKTDDAIPDPWARNLPLNVQPRTPEAKTESNNPFGLLHVSRTEEEHQNSNCFRSQWGEAYVNGFLQDKLDLLAEDHNCWLRRGVAGLKVLLERNVPENTTLDDVFPSCPVTITSAGNTFSIDLTNEKYHVNGVSPFNLVLLTSIHIGCMTLAFFLVYPVILMLSSATVLCELIDRPLYKQNIEKWQAILNLVVLFPLLVAGMACGMLGMGTSEHFRTEHGIIGLVTVVSAAVAVFLYVIEKPVSRWFILHSGWRRTQKMVNYVDVFFCQAILLLSGFALPDGIDDFGVMTLCATNMISTSLAFSLGMIVAFIWNAAMAAMAVQWWLVRRASPDQGQGKKRAWGWKLLRRAT